MNRFYILLFILIFSTSGIAQVYVEKQSRHRFAQMNIGFDISSSFGGNSQYISSNGELESFHLQNNLTPRLLIGGTHFWGHADFQIAIPLYSPKQLSGNQEVEALKGVETILKYYPFRIENKKVRPYIGTSFAPFSFQQINKNLEFPRGPELNQTTFPLLTGLTFNRKNHLFEFGISWNYNNQKDYYLSKNQIGTIHLPPLYGNFSYRYVFDTTISAEKDWESGRTESVTEVLAEKGILNGFFMGAGISSAFWLEQSSFNADNRPFIGKCSPSIMPDFTLGYYFHRPDINIGIAYRGIKSSSDTYGVNQDLFRKSIVLETTKFIFDYHGFVPFIGPAISYEQLSFKESLKNQVTINTKSNQFGYGVTFGWDIRPNRIQSWTLRTNLRWFPNLSVDVDSNASISFDNLEFNFIQLIIYPNRIF